MYIVILGAGKMGAYAASILSKEQHDVILIDKDAGTLERVGREIDLATLHTLSPSWTLLEEVLEHGPDLFFAATGDDETNLVACSIAKNMGFPRTIARVKSREYLSHPRLDLGRLFFVDYFIAAEVLAAQDLFKSLLYPGDVAVEHFAHGAIEMRTIAIPERWDKGDSPIKDLQLPQDLIVGLIRRKTDEGEKIIFPHGDDHIVAQDEVTIVGEAKIMHTLHEIFHIPDTRVHSVILAGGSLIACHLAHYLIEQGIPVRIIEQSSTKCEELAELLPEATIINRDAAESAFLKSERVHDAGALVSCTNHDGINLMITALSHELGCPKNIATVTDPSLCPALEKLGITPALSARVNITNRILSILHEKTILSVASLCNDAAKIIELKVNPSSKLVGIPLADLGSHLPKDLLIAVIENQGRVMIGKGHRILCPNDTVIVICHPDHIPQVQQLFQ